MNGEFDLPWIIVCANSESKEKQLSVSGILSKLAQFLFYSRYYFKRGYGSFSIKYKVNAKIEFGFLSVKIMKFS